MGEIKDTIHSREDFDAYWNENYVPVEYEDVREAYEGFVNDMEKQIFIQDYQEKNCICRDDFIENLHQDAQFTFQDALTEAFYDKNPKLYELAFALYEEAEMEGAEHMEVTFHENFNQIYRDFLNRIFDQFYEEEK